MKFPHRIRNLVILASILLTIAGAQAREHVVFAHFMVCLPYNGNATLESYQLQMRLAQQYGIDGFALNCGSWLKDPYYVERSTLMYEAAKQLNTGFKLFFSLDTASGLDPLPTSLDMMQRFYDHPNQFRHDGKPVFSAYSGPTPRWAETIAALKAAGHEVCFVPFFWTANYTLAPSYDGILNSFTDAPYLDGYFLFGIDAPAWDLIQGNRNCRRATAKLGKVYMATNSFAYNSANVRDFHGMRDYAAIWDGIIRDNADWVELVTWNDYTEDGHLSPAHAGSGSQIDMGRVNHDESYLDTTAYYSAWFKSGKAPAIRQEKLFYVYRERSKWQSAAFDPKKKVWTQLPDQIHDDVEDNVYATAFLTAPAELTIRTGQAKQTFKLAAGVSHVEMPFQPGVPQFTLKRQGKAVADFSGQQQIIQTPTEENSRLDWRNSNRTWAGSWCLGTAQRLGAESATVFGGAELVSNGGRKAVRVPATAGSGLKFARGNVATGPMNIRVRYLNPGPGECRLTLAVEGAPAYAIFPVFMPPTPAKEWTTVAFLWTPPAGTNLVLEHRAGDKGEALIESVELVPSLLPVADVSQAKTTPEPVLVEIPGGSFSMGDAHGDPDEVPVHPVTVAPFRMSTYEVTNAEYERCVPEHRRFRDDYSSGDHTPVVYVSWQQAALYCNWLSTQAGLTPAYDAKTWAVNLHAGYRLPTEAEWEYAASGRGEGRRYPWGKATPNQTLCNAKGNGNVAVGSYPDGASRDGIMDLAGNVAEWCTDIYHPYKAEAATDPCPLEPGAYRVIRGGSWGYYNRSQRVADREFNTQVYPGYYYIGFRVVLPAAATANANAQPK